MTSPVTVADARTRTAELLGTLGVPAEPQPDGSFAVPHGPVTVTIGVRELDGWPVLEIWAAVVPETTLSPALYRFAAETPSMYGRLCVARLGERTGQLQLSHALLADPLDEDNLAVPLSVVADTAADLAASLSERFPPPSG